MGTTTLLSNKININERNIYGKTALHLALQASHTATVEKLLKYKANPNKKDSNGFTTQDSAVASGVKELVNLFSGDQPGGSYMTIMKQADSLIALTNGWVDQQGVGSSPLTASGNSWDLPFPAIVGNKKLVPAAG